MLTGQLPPESIRQLLERYSLTAVQVASGETIPGSFWGDPEAGIIGRQIYLRPDTPVHSFLHETCHVICMDQIRRSQLDTHAEGDTDEENAVCYLQILLADTLPGFGKQRALQDMDSWGYSFRLGSAQRWFEEDAEDARSWLAAHGLIDALNKPVFCLRQ